MKKGLIITLAVIGAILIIIGIACVGSYNGFVDKEANIEEAKSNIQVQLQRRADLIPNFVATVKGYSDYEQSTYLAVTEARAKVAAANDAGELADAEAELNGAIDIWVNAVTEAYPDLKANENYIALQDELAGTENRIARARSEYNEIAAEYNAAIRKFPGNIIASMFGFEKVDLFTADASANDVPTVEF